MSDVLQQIHLLVGKIDGKVDLLVDQGKIQDDRHNALEARVRSVENRQHWYAGVSGMAGMVMGWIGQGIWKGH